MTDTLEYVQIVVAVEAVDSVVPKVGLSQIFRQLQLVVENSGSVLLKAS